MKPIFLVIFTIIYSLFYFISSYYIKNLFTINILLQYTLYLFYLFFYFKIKKKIEEKISDQTLKD